MDLKLPNCPKSGMLPPKLLFLKLNVRNPCKFPSSLKFKLPERLMFSSCRPRTAPLPQITPVQLALFPMHGLDLSIQFRSMPLLSVIVALNFKSVSWSVVACDTCIDNSRMMRRMAMRRSFFIRWSEWFCKWFVRFGKEMFLTMGDGWLVTDGGMNKTDGVCISAL